jgi:hypothetical protein
MWALVCWPLRVIRPGGGCALQAGLGEQENVYAGEESAPRTGCGTDVEWALSGWGRGRGEGARGKGRGGPSGISPVRRKRSRGRGRRGSREQKGREATDWR